MSNKTIQVVQQKSVLFLEDQLIAVKASDEEIYVSLGHLADALKLDRQGQHQRILRHTVLLSGYCQGQIETKGGSQMVYLLRVDLVPFWLAGVNTKRIKDDDRRQKVERYQQNVAKVLWEAFQTGQLTADPLFDELLQYDTDATQAYQMALAVMKLARNQVLLEARLNGRLDNHETQLQAYGQRIEEIEATLGNPNRMVNPDQAMQISQAVRAIGLVLSDRSGRNEYGGVYGELYRAFGITSYKQLPAHRFEKAMRWLTDWYQSLTDGAEIPF